MNYTAHCPSGQRRHRTPRGGSDPAPQSITLRAAGLDTPAPVLYNTRRERDDGALYPVNLVQLPVVLVWLIGFVLSLVYWRRHPKVSLLTFIAIAGFLASSLIGTYLSVWLPVTLQERGWSVSQIGVAIASRGIISSLVSAVLWGLLLTAIFGAANEEKLCETVTHPCRNVGSCSVCVQERRSRGMVAATRPPVRMKAATPPEAQASGSEAKPLRG